MDVCLGRMLYAPYAILAGRMRYAPYIVGSNKNYEIGL